jgi:Arc/MetJ-type ribon-helix-helix transcriptional regulator
LSQRFAEVQIAAGRFATIADVLSAGVEALQEREEGEREWIEELRECWAKGDEAVAHGDYFEDSQKEIMAHIRARIENS